MVKDSFITLARFWASRKIVNEKFAYHISENRAGNMGVEEYSNKIFLLHYYYLKNINAIYIDMY